MEIQNIFRNKFGLIAKISISAILVAVLGLGGFFAVKYFRKPDSSVPKDKYTAFLSEIYDTIKTNYWDSVKDDQLIGLYVLGTQKITEQTNLVPLKTEKELESFLEDQIGRLSGDQKKIDFSSQLADLVLANLQPFGRSRLYTEKQQADLQNRVENINPDADQYKVLGVTKDATGRQIADSYAEQAGALKKDTSAQAQQKLAELDHAYNTLSDAQAKQKYDAQKVEPTLEGKLLSPEIFYLKMSVFSPTMMDELAATTQKVDQGNKLDTLILDLRDNVGGLIDGLPYFLGPFIGNDMYAYQFFQQGNKEDFKTKTGWLQSLIRYKKVIVLINENTQSSAEVMASVLKKYNVGLLVGTKTRGWGTVERVFDLKNQIDPAQKFSVFLAHHITLRDDSQPIEGNGVLPAIDVSQKGWEQSLYNYYHYQPIVDAVKGLYGK